MRNSLKATALLAVLAALLVTGCQSTETKADAPLVPAIKSVRLMVPEADCISTGAAVDTLLRDVQGVTEVDVDIDTAAATVTYDANRTGVEQMKEALDAEMFEVSGVEALD